MILLDLLMCIAQSVVVVMRSGYLLKDNIIYLATVVNLMCYCIIPYQFLAYVILNIEGQKRLEVVSRFLRVPIAFMMLVIFTNPITKVVFTLGAQGKIVYSTGWYIMMWVAAFYACAITVVIVFRWNIISVSLKLSAMIYVLLSLATFIIKVFINQEIMIAGALIALSLIIMQLNLQNPQMIHEAIAQEQEEKLEAVRANREKSNFLANMSHEIRTPLNVIFGFLELLELTNLSSEQKEFIREAKSASEVLLHIINDILDLSKIEARKLIMENISFNLRDAIEDTVSLLAPKAAEKGLELYVRIKEDVPEEVIGDPSRLRQILNNLIYNAVKFTEKGYVSISMDYLEKDHEIALVNFEVEDTGIGIATEDIPKVFEAFNQADASTTRKYGGTGLGLPISYELIKMMGGDIRVESKLGEGSTFKFNVNLKIAKRASEQRCLFDKLKGKNIIIVDGNENNINIIKSNFQGTGVNIFEAKNAGNAINIIISNANTENRIDIAIIDYQMSDMTGYELATTIKTIPFAKEIKLILLINLSQKGESNVAQENGFLSSLFKPIRRKDLLNCISKIFGLQKEDEENRKIEIKDAISETKNRLIPKILLVEDNEINRKIFISMIKSRNFTCDVAVDGSEALKAVEKKDYDIIFMDCQMPTMDGYESTAKIRKLEGNKKHTRIVAMTANAMEGDSEKCIEAGMDDYISKPINFNKMFKIIEESIKEQEFSISYISIIDKYLHCFTKVTGLGEEDAKEIFEEYIACLPGLLKGINKAIDGNDFRKLAKLGHELKGSAGTLRITSIYELAIKLEEAAKKHQTNDCLRLFTEMKKILC